MPKRPESALAFFFGGTMALSAIAIRRLLQAALLALLLFPLLGWWLGDLRTFSGVGTVLACVWLVMAGVGMVRQKERR